MKDIRRRTQKAEGRRLYSANGKGHRAKDILARFGPPNYGSISFPENLMGQMKNFRSGALLLSAFCFLAFLSSCEDTFEPFQENDKYFFTFYGFLDASADTQWVRITPVRRTFDALPKKPDMEVYLEDLEDGSSVLMNNKLVQFGNQFNVINVWTEKEIHPGNSYRIRALNSKGDQSQVVVTIPDPFPIPKLLTESIPGIPPKYFLFIDDVENLADVQSRWHYRLSTPFWEEERYQVFSLKESAIKVKSRLGSYLVELNPVLEKKEIMDSSLVLSIPGGQIEFLEHQIYVASAGPEWDENVATIDDLVYNLPDGFSNVENGLGYMVGIFSRNIPFRTCLNEARELTGCPEVKPFF